MNSYEATFEAKLRKFIVEKIANNSEGLWRYPDKESYLTHAGFLQGLDIVLDEMDAIKADIDKGR